MALPSPAELRKERRETLPTYMIPTTFVELEALPLTPNGKIDRKALGALEVVSAAPTFARLETPTQESMGRIWSDLLGVGGEIGADQDFFDLGGHSLLAVQVTARVAKELGVELPVAIVFEARTIADLAAVVDLLGGGFDTASAGDETEEAEI